MKKTALNALVSKLQMADEITAATNIIEFTGDWTSTHPIALIRRRAGEWIFLPPLPYKEIACAGVFKYTTQCHYNVINGWRVPARSLMVPTVTANGCMTLNSKDGRTFFPSAIEWMQRVTAHSRHVYSSTLFPRYLNKLLLLLLSLHPSPIFTTISLKSRTSY